MYKTSLYKTMISEGLENPNIQTCFIRIIGTSVHRNKSSVISTVYLEPSILQQVNVLFQTISQQMCASVSPTGSTDISSIFTARRILRRGCTKSLVICTAWC